MDAVSMSRNCSGKEPGNETTCNSVKQAVGIFKLFVSQLDSHYLWSKAYFCVRLKSLQSHRAGILLLSQYILWNPMLSQAVES